MTKIPAGKRWQHICESYAIIPKNPFVPSVVGVSGYHDNYRYGRSHLGEMSAMVTKGVTDPPRLFVEA